MGIDRRSLGSLMVVFGLAVSGCKAKAKPNEVAPPVPAIVQPIVEPVSAPDARKCNTLDENKQALADIQEAIASARALAQAGKLSEARTEGQRAKRIEAACFGALKPATNWGKVEGALYSIDAIRRFPDLPQEWRARCARKTDILNSNVEMILCGPGFEYSVDPGASSPFALEVTAIGEDDPPSSADVCQQFVERTIPDLTPSATLNAGSVRIKFYKKAGVLVRAGWVRVEKTPLCIVTSCREDVGKGPHGGGCSIPDNARVLRPVAVVEQTEDGLKEAESLSLQCEVDRETSDGEVVFPHAGDPPGSRLPGLFRPL